jgi:hypothetical protein
VRAALLVIVIVVGAALIGLLADPIDAVPFAFFGLWAALQLSVADRLSADDADSAISPGEPAPALEPEPESESEPDVPIRT